MSEQKSEYITDEFLASEPDCPVFGLNLACVYPFPATVQSAYEEMAQRLAALDGGVYVYPFWETHVTIMTFLSFTQHRRPSPQRQNELKAFIDPLVRLMKTLFDSEIIKPFALEFQPPALTPKAAILQANNPTGEVARIRQRARELLQADKELHEQLVRAGLNVPGIIHSTILRFKKVPRDAVRFKPEFDAVAATTPPLTVTVPSILLTTETKPYMRAGEIVHRFELLP